MKRILECVPNVSEGRDEKVLNQLAEVIKAVDGVKLLDIDPGRATNRTVFTFAGIPEAVAEAAFQFVKATYELIDMTKHTGEHPRMGATDVCPFVPISGITMEETVAIARKVGERIGKELNLSGYFYEFAATEPKRKNLATVRSGEYEGLKNKIIKPEWKPDFGPAVFNSKFGAIAVGARNFLVAYNINLNTTSTRRANSIAFDIREKGRVRRIGDPLTGEPMKNENGELVYEKGLLKSVKAIGWYIEEYGIAQISTNITDISITSVHQTFEAAKERAESRGVRVTGSELVGLIPKQALLDAGKFYLEKQKRSLGISEEEIIKIAVKSLGLDDLKPFDPKKKIIEYVLEDEGEKPLINMKLSDFSVLAASENPAPGGGSVAAYLGTLGAALGTMVANLSSHKRGWDDKWKFYSDFAEKGENLRRQLLHLVDEDTVAFNQIMNAFQLPKSTSEEAEIRKNAIIDATIYAIEVPLKVMQLSYQIFDLCKKMAELGLQSSMSDAGVGALCAKAAVDGAYLNVIINASTIKNNAKAKELKEAAEKIKNLAADEADEIFKTIEEKLQN